VQGRIPTSAPEGAGVGARDGLAIEARELHKVFGATVAVEDLSLEVHRGEVFGFLGPNGAGKTTTVNLLLDLVRPTSGQAWVLGRRPGDPAAMARIGFLPEHFRFPAWMTARGFLEAHGRLYGMPDEVSRRRVPEVLSRVGLANRATAKLGTFSKGMTQRIGLAQALLASPEVLFLDEPTSALDPIGRREVRDIIREQRDAGTTVFLNSHLLSEVEVTCDRVAIVKAGRVVRVAPLDELAGGEIELRVTLRAWWPELESGLARWGPLQRVDRSTVRLTVHGDGDVADIARWLVGEGADVRALAPGSLSLEELFVRIVGESE
jgi:ABC-2 type transport system ATP-binding protein